MVLAHGDSLRSITMFIEELTNEEILDLEIPTEKPLFYDFNNGTLKKHYSVIFMENRQSEIIVLISHFH